MRVLLVEDEADLATMLRRTLSEEGFACDWSASGEDAMYRARSGLHDAIVLDLGIPEVDGLTILEALRRGGSRVPVIVVTARDALSDKLRGLNTGADDYLTKPFAMQELIARLRALIRRSGREHSPFVDLGDVRVNTASRTVERDGETIDLTAKEYAVLELLVHNRGTLVPRGRIYEVVWGAERLAVSNALDVYVSNLRKKLGHEIIVTRRGQGYLIP